MKKVLMFAVLLVFVASMVYGQEWVPTKLDISAPETIVYNFENDLEFDVNITGTPAKTVFCVFTKNQADNIVNIQNGYLGWHYVNKIDTCIYYNTGQNMQIGSNTVRWDGADMDGNKVPAGSYTYYLKGYDNVNFKKQAASVISIGCGRYDNIITHDYQGNPYSQPILYTDPFQAGTTAEGSPGPVVGSSAKDGQIDGEFVNRMKFIIGSSPDDASAIEKSWYNVWYEHCQYVPSPYDPDMFLYCNQ